jgi:hypothetical protein
MCLLNSSKANYESKHKQAKETKQTHTHKQKTIQCNLYHLHNKCSHANHYAVSTYIYIYIYIYIHG